MAGETDTIDNRRLGDSINGVFDLEDYYSFTVTEPGVEARIDLINFSSNLDLRLFDPSLNPIQTAASPGTTQESIPLPGGGPLILSQTGTYFVQVFTPEATPTPTTYSLSVSLVPPDRVGNDLAVVPAGSDPTPAVLDELDAALETEQVRSDFVGGSSGDVDVYNFSVPTGQQKFVSIELINNTPAADIDLELYDSANLSALSLPQRDRAPWQVILPKNWRAPWKRQNLLHQSHPQSWNYGFRPLYIGIYGNKHD
ncbi:MAG: hypothetical protein HC881_21540 [Leptolyngbyaceae cyanobacterium SL_7_1]|nr:hypothetical protein [Leptolyngbyaceae cyanobacterium SL_7_1]